MTIPLYTYICSGCGKRSPQFESRAAPTGVDGWLHTTRDDSDWAPMVVCSADCVESAKAGARVEALKDHARRIAVIDAAILVRIVP